MRDIISDVAQFNGYPELRVYLEQLRQEKIKKIIFNKFESYTTIELEEALNLLTPLKVGKHK